MTINGIGSIDPIQPKKKAEPANQVGESRGADSINISSAAQEKAEQLRVKEMALAAPEVRADRVAELKEKINDPSYISETLMNATADRIIDSLFG